MGNLTKNFSLSEFNCRDENNTPVPDELYANVKKLAEQLQVLRDYLGVPIHINSGYRTMAHNKVIGGEKNSYHLKGMAADITVRDLTSSKVNFAIDYLIGEKRMKQGGLGHYVGFTHYDIRRKKARW